MAIMSSKIDDNLNLTITIRGRFDYHSSGKFRHHFDKYKQSPKKYVIDLTHTESIDSTAIGLLLFLKELAGKERPVVLKNPNECITKVLNIARIDSMFIVEES